MKNKSLDNKICREHVNRKVNSNGKSLRFFFFYL